YIWHPTRQPIAIKFWENAGPPRLAYTTVGKWDSKGRDVKYEGETFTWRKRTEWRRFLDLPARAAETFELAMDVESIPGALDILTHHGWHIVDPMKISTNPWRHSVYFRVARGGLRV